MANSKIYLNVSYAEKDDVKILGARWDPAKKKWYAPIGMDIELFSKWQIESSVSVSKVNKVELGTVTYAKDKGFIAYSGNLPPWNL